MKIQSGSSDQLLKECHTKIAQLESRLQELEEERRADSESLSRLSEQVSVYQALLESAKDVIWTVNLDLRYTYVSPSVTRALGYSVDEIMSMNPLDGLTAESRDRLVAEYQAALALEEERPRTMYAAYTFEIERYRKDGSTVWQEIITTFLRDSSGKPSGILGISRDVMERRKMLDDLRKSREELEKRVQDRTGALRDANEKLHVEIIQRMRAEEALKNEREQLLAIFDSINEVISVIDIETHEILFTNKFIRNRHAKKLIGESCYEVLHGLAEPCGHCALAEAKDAQGEPYQWEYHNPTNNRDYISTDRIIKWSNGRAAKFHLGIDVTERKRFETALKESEEKYRLIFQKEKDAIVLMDAESDRIIDANESALKLWGYSREELLDMNAPDLSAEPELSRESLLAGSFDEGVFVPLRWHKKKNGTVFPVEISAGPLLLNGRKVVCSIVRDITRRIKSEEAMRASEERYRLLADNTLDVIWQVDRDLCFTYVNPAVSQLIGYSPEELIGTNLAECCDREHFMKIAQLASDEIAKGADGSGVIFETVLLKKNKETIPVEVHGTVIWDENGVPKGFQGISRDITDRKKAENELKAALAFVQTLMNAIPNPVFYKDDKGRYLGCNRAFTEWVGHPEHEILGKTAHDIVIPDLAGMYCQQDSETLTNPGVKVYESSSLHADGFIRSTIVSKATFLNPDDSIGGLIGVISDVTNQKRALKSLEESEERLSLAQTAAKMGVWERNLETGEVFWSDELCSLIGLEPGSLQPSYEMWINMIHPEDRNTVEQADRDAISQAKELNVEWRLGHEANTPRWMMSRGRPVFNEAGEPVRFLGICIEISDKKKAEEALKESEEFNRRLVERAPFGIVYIEKGGTVQYVNQAAKRIAGLPEDLPAPTLGRNMGEFPSLQEPQRFRHGLQRLLAGESISDFEVPYISSAGKRTVLFGGATPKFSGDETVEGAIIMFADISERKRSEELERSTARLKAVADLSSGVAHHFNNLLQIVTACSSLCIDNLNSGDISEVQADLEKMLQAASLGAETVKRLQTFAQTSADGSQLEGTVFDIAVTVKNAVGLLEPLWKAEPEMKGFSIGMRMELDNGCLVKGQENELFESLVNLVKNAVEAMPSGGDIAIKAYKDGPEVVVVIRDSGTGISPDNLSRVFQPFWSTKGVAIGKGMGLAVTHGLVRKHGGTISVQSRLDEGAVFTIRLPLSHDHIAELKRPPLVETNVRLRILVIEDEEHISSLLQKLLARAGHRVLKALSGQEGLAIFRKEPIDLILCDLGMPGMSGWEVGKAIRLVCDERGIVKPTFIILTGWGGQELKQKKIAESGTDWVLAKPISPRDLLNAVQNIAGRFNVQHRDL